MQSVTLYSGRSSDFCAEALSGQIETTLENAMLARLAKRPTSSEKRSWRESLGRVGGILKLAGLDGLGVSLEYCLPASSRRLDFLATGLDSTGRSNAQILELKQWEHCQESDTEYEVITRFQGGPARTPHPSVQADGYRQYLIDFNEAFRGSDPIVLDACVYLHNYDFTAQDPLLDPKFNSIIERCPLYGRQDHRRLTDLLVRRLGTGDGMNALGRIRSAPVKASVNFLEHVAEVINLRSPYVLLDDQRTVYERVLKSVSRSLAEGRKAAVIANGGPGTGKSVIALQLMATLGKKDHREAHFVTGSGAFTKTLKKAMGRRAGVAFHWTNAYVNEPADAVEVLIIDEAHRIRDYSTDRFRRRLNSLDEPQIDEILRTGKVCVFFIDDLQGITPTDAATSRTIRTRAIALGIDVYEYQLTTQFRLGGMDSFLQWIENVLNIRSSEMGKWSNTPSFEFRVYPTAAALDRAIRQRASEGHSARLVAGYCWNWSRKPGPDGSLVDDIVIGGFKRPWNAREGSSHLAKGIPPASLWAYDPGGQDQVGCVYTAQGFEFDYAGIIFGQDIVFDQTQGDWVGQPKKSFDRRVKQDPDRFTDLVKRTYRVLLSRGLKGCYVYFLDDSTRDRFISLVSDPSEVIGR